MELLLEIIVILPSKFHNFPDLNSEISLVRYNRALALGRIVVNWRIESLYGVNCRTIVLPEC